MTCDALVMTCDARLHQEEAADPVRDDLVAVVDELHVRQVVLRAVVLRAKSVVATRVCVLCVWHVVGCTGHGAAPQTLTGRRGRDVPTPDTGARKRRTEKEGRKKQVVEERRNERNVGARRAWIVTNLREYSLMRASVAITSSAAVAELARALRAIASAEQRDEPRRRPE